MAKKQVLRRSTSIQNFNEIGEVLSEQIYQTADTLERVAGSGSMKRLLKVYKTAGKPMVEDIEIFMKQHKRSNKTWESFNEGLLLVNEDDYVQFKLGFDLKKDGLPAVFLEHGDNGSPMRMPNKAYYFMYYATENNIDYFTDTMIEEFNQWVMELREGKSGE